LAWGIEWSDGAIKDLKSLDPKSVRRIRDFLVQRVAALGTPRHVGEPLVGNFKGFWRYRVGSYRVVCRLEDDRLVVFVVTIGHRRDVYR